MKLRKITLVMVSVMIVVLVFVVAVVCLSDSIIRTNQIRRAKPVIAKVEKYLQEHGSLPAKLADVGVEEDPYYYQKQSETNYVIWFGRQLGESVTYVSNEKTWSY